MNRGAFPRYNELQANFGLRDATNIDRVRVEWPSGIVQTLTNVAPRQSLTVVEHQQQRDATPPSFTGVTRSTSGAVHLSVAGFGQATLVRTLDFKYELRGGSHDDRISAREWISLFFHDVAVKET